MNLNRTHVYMAITLMAMLTVAGCCGIASDDADAADSAQMTITDYLGTKDTTDPLKLTVTATVGNATTVSIAWGDASSATSITTTSTSESVSADHTYATAGTYEISITAASGELTLTEKASYDTATGTWAAVVDTVTEEKTWIDEHGWILVGFIIAAIIMAIATLVTRNWILGIGTVIVMIAACVVYHYDLATVSDIVDSVKSLRP